MTSRNAGSVRTRTVGSAIYNMAVQTSNIISSNVSQKLQKEALRRDAETRTQVYRNQDKPLYRTGNAVLLALVAYNIILIISSKLYYRSRNARREKIWGRMSEGDRAYYLETTHDQGNKRCVPTLELLF